MDNVMNGLIQIARIRQYCSYLEEHLNNVSWAWRELQERCKDMRFIYDDFVWSLIDQMVKEHDISKFSKEEFIPYCNHFFPPTENKGTETKAAFDEAWEHHKELNEHHWQNWTNKKKFKNPYEEECHCVCMVIDWMAMGKKFGDTAQEYYEKNAKEINLPAWAIDFIKEIFAHLRKETKEGELK